jgi:[Skp1-protein]-hydroxyproline N-acetylglucosaminyltransferase
MTTIKRPSHRQSSRGIPAVIAIFIILFGAVLYLAVDSRSSTTEPSSPTEGHARMSQNLKTVVAHKREQISAALKTLTEGNLPNRLRTLRQKHEIIGERLAEVKAGTETVEEILHGHDMSHHATDQPPMELKEIIEYLDHWIHQLHETLVEAKHATFEGIWQAYHDLAVKTLYPWDREYLRRMPPRRDDGSIFLSVATYRDENCFNTVYKAYEKAKNPEKLFIGLTQQNCHQDCKSGVLSNLSMVEVPPDDDCYQKFCDTDLGQPFCANSQLRVLNIDEPESLGPYAARYFTSKLWYGEQWYMQIDAHMTFANHWDSISVDMLNKAPSSKPILSHYPPSHLVDLDKRTDRAGARLCGPVFATSDLESQIIRLEGAGYDPQQLEYPAFAPFTAAGYFVAHSNFLREVPFDPFLPWIFMGEEIIMSTRLWTAGYDIFSPSRSVVGHMYVRRHKPKFWESVHRLFATPGIHNPLQAMVLDRIKFQLGYPEAARDMMRHRSLLTAVEQYGMGKARPLEEYLKIVGLNMTTKEITYTGWCEEGYPPPGFEKFNNLYPNGKGRGLSKAATEKAAQ